MAVDEERRMTMPRRISPGRSFLLTRRSEDRRFVFRPDPVMDQIFLYALALFATKFGILVSAAVLMSTHVHIVLTDVHGCLPIFMMHFNRILALATACHRRTVRTIWDKRKPSVVELLTPDAIIQKTAYTIGNPVSAGLVRTWTDWPGTIVNAAEGSEQEIEVKRPDVFFGKWWPEVVRLRVAFPPAVLETASVQEASDAVNAEVERIEADAAMKRSGPCMGPRRILECSPFRRAVTEDKRGVRSPTFAVGRGRRDEYLAAVFQLRQFRAAYRSARERWRSGDRAAAFPHGTWWMTQFHGAELEPPPRPALAA